MSTSRQAYGRRRPRQTGREYIRDPKQKPNRLQQALDNDATPVPLEPTFAVLVELVHGQTEGGARGHQQITQGKFPDVGLEQPPLAQRQWVASLSQVAQHGGDDHDGEADPEEREEAMEVVPCRVGIEMRDTGGVVYPRKPVSLALGADEFTGRGCRLDRRRCVRGHGGAGSTAYDETWDKWRVCWYWWRGAYLELAPVEAALMSSLCARSSCGLMGFRAIGWCSVAVLPWASAPLADMTTRRGRERDSRDEYSRRQAMCRGLLPVDTVGDQGERAGQGRQTRGVGTGTETDTV